MLSDLLNEKTITVISGHGLSWEQAIATASKPLLDNGTIQHGYIESMINVVQREGPYINIGPQIALAHSQPDGNVNQVGMALLKTNDSIALTSQDHMINLWFVLAAIDSTSHLESIKDLTKLLTNSDNVVKLLSANSSEDIFKIIKSVN